MQAEGSGRSATTEENVERVWQKLFRSLKKSIKKNKSGSHDSSNDSLVRPKDTLGNETPQAAARSDDSGT